MQDNTAKISSDEDAASLIQKWYRNKREIEHQACEQRIILEPEIVLLSKEDIATHTSDENDEQEDSVDGTPGVERALGMGVVKLGLAVAITKVGTLVLNSVSAPVDQDDVAAAIVISKGSEAQ